MKVFTRRRIAFDHLTSQPPALKAFLGEKTVEISQQLNLASRVHTAQLSKGQEVGKPIGESAEEMRFLHD
jgi:hypothetical protein